MQVKKKTEFESRGSTSNNTLKIVSIIGGLLIAFVITLTAVMAWHSIYAKASDLEKHEQQSSEQIKEIKDAQAKAQKEAAVRQIAILDAIKEIK